MNSPPAINRQPRRVSESAPVRYSAAAPNRPDHAVPLRCSSTPPPSSSRLQSAGTGLPQFVRDDFDAFLELGILAQSFLRLRLRCGDCGYDKLVAFSCKRHGCRSYTA